jgi:hypothetical protein
MATTRIGKTKKSSATTSTAQNMGVGAVRDIVEEVVRTAVRTQARELETILSDINTRLTTLENR